MLMEADNSLEAQTYFLAILCCLPPTVDSQEGLLQDSMVTGLEQAQRTDREDGEEGYLELFYIRDNCDKSSDL